MSGSLKSAANLENAFAKLLNVPAQHLSFEFFEDDGWIIARQTAYLEKDDWMKVYEYTKEAGKAERDEKTGEWIFKFPRAKPEKAEPAGLPLHLQPRETPKADETTADRISEWEKDYEKQVAPKPPETRYITVPVDPLLSMPFQSRISEDSELEELAESVKTYGVLEPILIRQKPSGFYEVVAGERRLEAAKKAGLSEVPAIVKALTDEEAYLLQLTENLQRKDYTEEEKRRALGELARRTGWNARQIAEKLKRTERWVFLYLPSELKDQTKVEAGRLGGLKSAERLSAKSEEPRHVGAWIKCDGCGRLTKGEPDSEGKVYCSLCREKRGIESRPEQGVQISPEEVGAGPAEEDEAVEENLKPKQLLTGFSVECPECHRKLLINHIDHPNGKITHEVER